MLKINKNFYPAIACFSVVIITFITFLPTLGLDFVIWDDDISITTHKLIRSLDWAHIKKMFQKVSVLLKYAPFYWVSLGATYKFYQLDPFGYHLHNMLLHTASAAILFSILYQFFNILFPGSDKKISATAALIATLFWSIHPLRVNAVSLAANRTYCQAIFFILLSLLSYFKFMNTRKSQKACIEPYYWLTIILFIISLLSFPIGITFLIVFIAFDYYMLQRNQVKLLTAAIEKIPIILITFAVFAINVAVRINPEGIRAEHQFSQLGFHQIMKAFYMWAFYIWKPLIPLKLTPLNPVLIESAPTDPNMVISALLIIFLTITIIIYRKRFPGLFIVWIIHLIILTPVLGLTDKIHYPAERYAYLQGITWSLVIGALVHLIYGNPNVKKIFKKTLLYIAFMTIAILISFTMPHILIWKNTITLGRHIISELDIDYYKLDIYHRMGVAYFQKGKLQEAIFCFNIVLNNTNEDKNGLDYLYRGMSYAISNQPDKAIIDLLTAIEKHSDFAPVRAHFWLADSLLKTGRPAEAVVYFKKAFDLGLRSPILFKKMGRAYEKAGDTANAVQAYKTAEMLASGNDKKSKTE